MTFDSGVVFISPTGHKVEIATGNLQYKDGEGWRFAEHQYDMIGSWNPTDWVDLFGWGAWTGDATNPLFTGTSDAQYQFDPRDFMGTINGHNDWRTMTQDECNWFFSYSNKYPDRTEKVGLGTVNGVHGLVVLPDNWLLPTESSFVPQRSSGWNTNVYTIDQWTVMENAGAIFLPAAGQRYDNGDETIAYVNKDEQGYYWASDPLLTNSTAWDGTFRTSQITVGSQNNYKGCSVRLIRNLD